MSDLKWILVALALGAVLLVLLWPGHGRLPQLELGDGEKLVTWMVELKAAPVLRSLFADTRPRIAIESAATAGHRYPAYPANIAEPGAEVAPRIMFASASTIASRELTESGKLKAAAAGERPRLVLEGAAGSSLDQSLKGSDELVAITSRVDNRLIIEDAWTSKLQTLPATAPQLPPLEK